MSKITILVVFSFLIGACSSDVGNLGDSSNEVKNNVQLKAIPAPTSKPIPAPTSKPIMLFYE
jgi:hypothetical protein